MQKTIEKLVEPCECGSKEIEVIYKGSDDYHIEPLSMKCTKCGKEQIKTITKRC